MTNRFNFIDISNKEVIIYNFKLYDKQISKKSTNYLSFNIYSYK